MARTSTRSSPSRSQTFPPPRHQLPRTPAHLTIVGRGKVGRSLVRAFRAAGHSAILAPGHADFHAPSPSGTVFLTVPDGAVRETAAAIARLDPPPRLSFVHVSGALGLDALEPLAARYAVGSFHPLRSFPRPQPPGAFKGIVVAIEANRPALARRLARIARDLGARPRTVAGDDRVLYHAAAVFASNYGVALLGVAASLLEEIGWGEAEAVAALLPLMAGALAEAGRIGVAGALTGPVRRGDPVTIERHLVALERLRRRGPRPPVVDLYRMLGAIALAIAREAGLGPAAAERVNRALTRKVAATRRRWRR